MMRTLRVLLACSLLAVGTASAQDWKGKATLSGTVTDAGGKAISGATVTLTFVDLNAGTETKTNSKGQWEVKNLANGKWVIRISKEGFDPQESPVEIGGQAKNPHVQARLAPVGSAGANVDLETGDQKARELVTAKKYAEARAIYQDLLAKYPKAVRIHIALARAYSEEGLHSQAADELKKYLESDPQNLQYGRFLAGEYAKAGRGEEALQVMKAIQPAAMKDAADLRECGFSLLRLRKPLDAVKFFDLAAARFPNDAINYYYRGVSEWQIGAIDTTLGTPESKAHFDKATADLNKFVRMAPNAPEAAKAKEILGLIK